jgi:hypothetical protein
MQSAQAGFYTAGNRLAGAAGGLLGSQDPEMAKAAALQGILKQANPTTPEGLASLAQTLASQGFGQQAMQAMDQARQAQLRAAQLGKARLEEQRLTLSAAKEDAMTKELAALPPDATQEDYLKVVTKYGDAKTILPTLQASMDRAAARQQQADLQQERLTQQDKLSKERAQERRDFAILVNGLKQGNSQGKPLSTNDIKEINKLKVNVDTANNTIDQAENFIKLIDDNKMVFGASENALGATRKLFGKANESDLNKVEFEQFVTSSVNNILNLAKGPQTDQDAKRAEKQIIDGLSKNDNKAVKRGLTSLQKVWEDAKQTDKGALELFSSERGGKSLIPSTEARKADGVNNDPLGIRTKK